MYNRTTMNTQNPRYSLIGLPWLACTLAVLGIAPACLHAQATETVLYNFPSVPNGSTPYASVIRDAAGNLFGTASKGGLYNSGVIFEVDTAGNETVLYNFTGAADGGTPEASLFRDTAGNLYGTAMTGGAKNSGTVYKLDTAGKLTVLHNFQGGTKDGTSPQTPVLLDGNGSLYGTTQYGGASHGGVVYKVDSTGQETLVYSFPGGTDGAQPMAGLTIDAAGNLYGTTAYGGYSDGECRAVIHVRNGGCGVVFKIDTAGNYSLLYSFGARPDGEDPEASVTLDDEGNIYGTTYLGGTAGMGAVYKIDTTGQETVLYSFDGFNAYHPTSGVVFDSSGNLYGVTSGGDGSAYKLDPAGNQTILYSFTGGSDGGDPTGVAIDTTGNLYGTTQLGGPANLGAVFKLDPAGNETVLNALTGGTTGNSPRSGLVRDTAGNLYGTTYYGGAANAGVLYKVDAAGGESVVYSFTGINGVANPSGSLARDAAGNFYGATFNQTNNVLFKVDAAGQVSVLPTYGYQAASVSCDAAGNVYGTETPNVEGYNYGLVFKWNSSGYKVLYNFTDGADGAYPVGGVVPDAAGNLYGTAVQGGGGEQGVVYKLSPTGQYTLLYTFAGGADGGQPLSAVTPDAAGNLFGTVSSGGASGYGGVFKLDPSGNETMLYSFTEEWTSGTIPYSNLAIDAAGNLYGTAFAGGGTGCEENGCGSVYMVNPSGQYTLLHSFTGGADGGLPAGGVILDAAGNLYGTASTGGEKGGGVMFKLTGATAKQADNR